MGFGAQIEQEYGERLLRLAATSKIGEHEEGSFAETLSRIPSTLETTGRAHIDLAQQLRDHLEIPLDGFLKEQREIRKKQHAQVESIKQLKYLHENEVARAREYYSAESTKLMSLETHFTIEMEKEIEEQRRLVIVAEQVYKRSIDNLNIVNEKWIYDWKHSANVYQEMELKRINYLRSTLWSFANIMTSTFNIDEECCDRIRAALEITDVQKDIIDFVQSYGTGTQLPVPIPYEVFYKPTSKPSFSQQASSESLEHSVTVLTNPDEELKSVDIQLQQLEHMQTPRAEVTHELSSNSQPTYSAMEEVEQMLNQNNDSYHEPVQSLPPIMINNNHEPVKEGSGSSKFDENREINTEHVVSEAAPINTKSSDAEPLKYKPVPNPKFSNSDEKPLNNGVQSSIEKNVESDPQFDEDDDDNEEDYKNKMPRPPPKDEKWVISSIRRPQQVPIKATGNETSESSPMPAIQGMAGMSISSPVVAEHVAEETRVHQPKVHKPVVPLAIEIPNPVNKHPQMAAHQAIEDARRHSQMPPTTMNRPQDRLDEVSGIRPAPWQNNGMIRPEEASRNSYMAPHPNGYVQYRPPDHLNNTSSLQPNNPDPFPQQHSIYAEKQPKNNKSTSDFTVKSGKDAKSGGRFSLFFTGGNKKDKKKDKDSYPDWQQHQQQQILQQQMDHQNPPNHYAIYQPYTTNDLGTDKDQFSRPVQAPPVSDNTNRFICYVKAQWPFEATIDGEMSFNQDEVLGILHKQSDGWWQAERLISQAAGQRGLVPGNYMIDAPSPMQQH
ncbi:hypothetical protein G6F16_001316 [Rhizopus arrhizus]|nr:hypothetical protein G6F21_002558 [Rhizopus arrhizus]KAG0799406.1 hypothetical protein G6F22_003259 [Rhizopus arrhizus]KAG0809207.1 hypothetical protein G6F20_008955 [Rhizopus arrhizus]KAG0826127.1 hypothetical protein G6F18_010108 [Rhizopus arrhizus]KAG0826803.1 hypothetical protein G6F19_009121 [Rhizopus arrhizus]